MKKFGGNAPASSKEVIDKMKETSLKRYGVDNYTKTDNYKQKYKQTCLEKYGVESVFQTEKQRQKSAEIQLEKAWNTIQSWRDFIIPMFSKEEYLGAKDDIEYEWKCVKCGNVFKQRIYTTHFNKDFDCLPRCLNCYPFGCNTSQKELELLDFVHQYFPNAGKDRKLISPLELDIVIPELKLAIEFNGVFYHALNCSKGVQPGYHLNKTLACNEKGYRLIHIWEDEWNSNEDEIKTKLEKIFKGEENLVFEDDEIILDRSLFNNIEIPDYILKEEVLQKSILRDRIGGGRLWRANI